ncbi:MAG TPA: transcription-repair coupling factor, partial [Candidatus Dormibacteraeota bacterium]|nr:transcription-repair coupling factor [Candidatus Dormibacteraeota bacterium]
MQDLARRVENGGVLSCSGVTEAAQPFFAALARRLFPKRAIVVVTQGLKTQESFQQDIGTYLELLEAAADFPSRQPSAHPIARGRQASPPLFYPAWEVLPHEQRLPHADVISERLHTLILLSDTDTQTAPTIVTSVAALLQRTFSVQAVRERTRVLKRGDRSDLLDLVEWLEAQGYEPEAQVTQKGEMALRGGILDVFPLTSPWPVRMEFFGDELESLRFFEPLTQISREEDVQSVTLPPAGELGILKRANDPESGQAMEGMGGTLLDHLGGDAILLLCEPQELTERAAE